MFAMFLGYTTKFVINYRDVIVLDSVPSTDVSLENRTSPENGLFIVDCWMEGFNSVDYAASKARKSEHLNFETTRRTICADPTLFTFIKGDNRNALRLGIVSHVLESFAPVQTQLGQTNGSIEYSSAQIT